MRILSGLLALCAAACVGDAAELGGVTSRMTPPTETRPCDLDEVKVVRKGAFAFPGDAAMFMQVSKTDVNFMNMAVRYDITPDGMPVNLYYVGPQSDMRHATRQKVIRAVVDAVQDTRFEWIGTPAFATSCEYSLDVVSGFRAG